MSYANDEKPVPAPQDTGLVMGTNEVSSKTKAEEINFSDTDAVDFLRRYSPEGPWCLATFSPMARGASFRPDKAEDAAEFVRQWDGRQNVYFLLGIPQDGVVGQPKKDKMLGSFFLWVDLDPRAGEDPQEERQRILVRLTNSLPEGVPPPTFIVDSGRGYWGFWKLSKPCLDPDLVERHNKRLADLFGALGDNCWNINRVGRLPGTINTKTGSKATLVRWQGDYLRSEPRSITRVSARRCASLAGNAGSGASPPASFACSRV